MKIVFYSPYLPKHCGGGEKYLLDCARVLAEQHDVFVALPLETFSESSVKAQYETFFGMSLAKVSFIPGPLGTDASFWHKLQWTKQWDVLYYLTDGSLFFSLATKNVLHIQIPFTNRSANPVQRLKLGQWQTKNANSDFTRQVVERSWKTKIGYVHYPLIETPSQVHEPTFLSQKKKIILSVGRFFTQLHSKRQDVLVEMFAELFTQYKRQIEHWQLVLIGGVEDAPFAERVKEMAKDLPVTVIHDADRVQLEQWYQKASIYWHAAGFDVDERQHPEKVEHFGISTVEAMSYGVVPIVIGKGGQKEILGKGLQELLWLSKSECIASTLRCIQSPKLRTSYQQMSVDRAQSFGLEAFTRTLEEMIS